MVETFKVLLRLFLRRYSTCLYVLVLAVLGRVTQRFRDDRRALVILESDSLRLLDYLALLADRTLHPAIITRAVSLLGYLLVAGERVRRLKGYR